ncbi:Histidine phosphatase superfamily clade-2 [Botryosphaeria dothidea]|uniref:Histidine phosphatase superfamily clade-2 n=1 Tax=Botryosphaeria dothidea TaxID=55169 RepID=A0A8H4N0K0_9PEZI|nr:Histidine phosphatase superfamily clade-2 [Botryosphaeria dothidea]
MLSAAATTLLLSALPLSAAESVLGVYIFHRHGDRTPKALAPANLTDLGYQQVYQSGQYYRNRYVASDADSKVSGLNTDIVKQSQISVTAPSDTVLQNSATGFLQGLYPPVGSEVTTETLRNGSSVSAPLNGYQLIPVSLTSTGAGSEDAGWLQDTSDCGAAETSSNNYFLSDEYSTTLDSTHDFYQNLMPVVNATFSEDYVTFKNAYVVYDLINVAEIHNTTINSSDLLTNSTLFQLRTLADQHEWGLAYNASDDMRAVAGMQLAGEILQYLNSTINGKGSKKFGIQFGAYATFFSFFGLADLPAANPDFRGVTDYASSMAFELYTPQDNVTKTNWPAQDDMYVRFLFHNGTASSSSEPVAYPLFGGSNTSISWNDFVSGMEKFSIRTTEQWCTKCGNTTGTCAAYAGSTSSSGSDSGSGSSGSGKSNGISTAVGGVIGAMVTLAVVLGLEALVMLVGGFRLARKNKTPAVSQAQEAAEPKA